MTITAHMMKNAMEMSTTCGGIASSELRLFPRREDRLLDLIPELGRVGLLRGFCRSGLRRGLLAIHHSSFLEIVSDAR
jgi:hypothetical protein